MSRRPEQQAIRIDIKRTFKTIRSFERDHTYSQRHINHHMPRRLHAALAAEVGRWNGLLQMGRWDAPVTSSEPEK